MFYECAITSTCDVKKHFSATSTQTSSPRTGFTSNKHDVMATDTHLLAIGATFHFLHDLDTLPQRQTELDVRVRHDKGRDEEDGDDQVEVEWLTPVDPVGARRRTL